MDRVVLVLSGKGGVGKSTVSVNVAVALKQMGFKSGLLDADIFGPSIPKLTNLAGQPRLSDAGQLLPLVNFGIPTMSMGYLVPPENAVVWRGMMVTKALQQLMFDVEWPHLDYLVVDMPPGTGDTQLNVGQQLKVDGAVIVLTPQDVALADVVKGIAMFEKVGVPLLGLVQNMSHFVCPHCAKELAVFGSGGAAREAEKHKLPLLALIPLNGVICEKLDQGRPVALDPELGKPYYDIARLIVERFGPKLS